jgi:anti-sigma factor RsiW
MRCPQARQWFGAYWDDEITQAERECLESHFASCTACRTEYEEFARTVEWVGELPRHEAAPELVERVLAAARRTAPAPDRLRDARPAWVPIAAAATLLIIAAAWLGPWIGVLSRGGSSSAVNVTKPSEPQLVAQVRDVRGVATTGVPGGAPVQALVDSLIDHSEDVNFVLDPVQVSRGRTASRTPSEPGRGQQAVITF